MIAERHWPQLRAGGITAINMVLWVEPGHEARAPERAHEILEAFTAELAESPELCLVTNPGEVHKARERGQLAILLGAEGLAFLEPDPLGSLDRYVRAGVRLAQLTWNERNFLASGYSGYPIGQGILSDGGLTETGREVLTAMAKARLLLDLSHLNEHSFWAALSEYPGTLLVSHANARALQDHPRNLTDDQLRAVAQRGGVVGACAFAGFLRDPDATLEDLVDHLEHMATVMGTAHVGLGFDFGDYLPDPALYSLGPEPAPMTAGLQSARQVPDLLTRLRDRGFTPDEVAAIAHGNFLRLWSGAVEEVTARS